MDELKFYKIADGRVWDIKNARYVTEYDETCTVTLYSNGKPGGEDYLKRTLKFYGYTVGDELLTDDERAEAVRKKRDALLQATDWYLMPDYPATEEGLEAVKTYRQALRDLPLQEGFPKTVEWPAVPEVLGE